jgi:hypothetical protein
MRDYGIITLLKNKVENMRAARMLAKEILTGEVLLKWNCSKEVVNSILIKCACEIGLKILIRPNSQWVAVTVTGEVVDYTRLDQSVIYLSA